MSEEMKLSVEIKNIQPIELSDLTQSLNSLADEYRRFIERSDVVVDPDQVKLYVKEIKTGSVLAELAALAPLALPLINYSATVLKYAEHLKMVYDYLVGNQPHVPRLLERQTLQNLSNIVEPVAKDKGAQLNIGALNLNGNVVVNFNYSSLEANAIQNSARKEIEKLKEPDTGTHSKVLMYLYQARDDMTSKTGDKSIIESIYKGPVKTIFIDENIKSKILRDEPNPFNKAFIVDVFVETIRGVPKLYKVIELYEIIDRDFEE